LSFLPTSPSGDAYPVTLIALIAILGFVYTFFKHIFKGDYSAKKHFTPLITHISEKRCKMLFCGLELNLNSDGTYFLEDTTGG
jgi:hypothetical protein